MYANSVNVVAETTKVSFLRTWIVADAVTLFSNLLQSCSDIFVCFRLISKAA